MAPGYRDQVEQIDQGFQFLLGFSLAGGKGDGDRSSNQLFRRQHRGGVFLLFILTLTLCHSASHPYSHI